MSDEQRSVDTTGTGASSPTALSTRQRLGLLAIGLLLGLAVVEIVLRCIPLPHDFRVHGISGTRWVGHPFLPFAGRPGMEFDFRVHEVEADVKAKHNAYGFRAHEFPESKRPEDFFIVCLGGSTTWGAAAESNAETWPEMLERLLAEKYPERNIKVFNFGTDFATSVYSVVTLSLIGVYLQPDLVLAYEGWNDYGAADACEYRTDQSHVFADFDPRAVTLGVQRNLPEWLRALYSVALLTFVIDDSMRINDFGSYVLLDNECLLGDHSIGARRVLENLRTIHSIARGHGAEAIFSTIQFFDGTMGFNDPYRAFFEANGYLWVDQDRLIPDGDPTIQFDLGHFTKKGREAMARNFFEYIVDRGLVSEVP